MQIVVFGRDFHSGLRHDELRLRCALIIQDHVSRHDLPVVKELAFDLVGLDDNRFTLQGCIGHIIFHISLAAVHRDAQQLLILCDGGHRLIRHDKGGLFLILFSHSNIAVVHFPAVEHIARAALCRDLNGLALNGGVLVCSAELHVDLVQSLEHSLQGHFPSGHRKLKGLVLQLLLRQAVHTGHFPVAELLACGGRVCRCDDLIALDSLSRGSAIDGVGAPIHRDGLDCLVLRFHDHIALEHLEGGLIALGVCEGHTAVLHYPVVELATRDGVGRNGDLSALYCLRQRCNALFCRDGVQLIVACLQLHILVRHGECGSVVCCAANQLCIRDAADNLPPHELVALSGTVIGGHSDRLVCIGRADVCAAHFAGAIRYSNRMCRYRCDAQIAGGKMVFDGVARRVMCSAAFFGVVFVACAGIDDAACHAARALVLDGDRDRALDRNIAPHDVETIPLTRDRHLGGLFHRHIAGHGGAFFRSNFHLAVTADLNIAEDGNIGLGRDLDVLCIYDRQFASYSCFT